MTNWYEWNEMNWLWLWSEEQWLAYGQADEMSQEVDSGGVTHIEMSDFCGLIVKKKVSERG